MNFSLARSFRLASCAETTSSLRSQNIKMVFKWSEENTLLFLENFKNYQCLWDSKISEYRDKIMRASALKSFIKDMNLRVTTDDVKHKIKTIRTRFTRELGKIRHSTKNGISYVPSLYWYNHAEFLTNACVPRSTSFNIVVPETVQLPFVSVKSESAEEESPQEIQNEGSAEDEESFSPADGGTTNDYNEPHTTNDYSEPTKTNDYSEPITINDYSEPITKNDYSEPITINDYSKPITTNDYSEPITTNVYSKPKTPTSSGMSMKRKRRTDLPDRTNFIDRTIREFKTASDQTKNVQNDDEFDLFCKSLAMQLRNMPLDKALICQEKLQSVIVQERLSNIYSSSDPLNSHTTLTGCQFCGKKSKK